MSLSDYQKAFLVNCSHRWNIKTGATRSGKTFVDVLVTIPKRVLACRGEGLIVLLGNTKGTLERNILEPMRAIWGADNVGEISSDNTVQLFGKKCYALGADTKKHVARIQGAAFEYAYGDEITTWSEDVFNMLKSRLSCPHSHFDGTCNPAGPRHWFKLFIDSDADVFVQAYTIDDNPFLTPEFVAALKKEYAGTVYYNRFILGQWAAAEGIIYRAFADDPARFRLDREALPQLAEIRLGVDFGGNGSFHAFVAVGVLPWHAGVVALASRRMDPRGKDADALGAAFTDFAREVIALYGEVRAVYCDSAEQTLIQHIRSTLRGADLSWLADRVYNSKKCVITDRIRLTSILMGAGRFWFLDAAAALRDALTAALWESKTDGPDRRLDNGSTDIDSLDAFEYTIERDMKSFMEGVRVEL